MPMPSSLTEKCSTACSAAAFQAAAQAQVAGRRKLDGVAEQVDEDLLDAQGVTHEAARHLRCQVDAQFETLFLDMADEQVVDVVEQHGQLEIQLLDAQLAGLDARKSRMSLMMPSRWSAARRILLMCCCWTGLSAVSRQDRTTRGWH
jgi:hypothetical protein